MKVSFSSLGPDLQGELLGKTSSYQGPEPISEAMIRLFAYAVDDMNPYYVDPAFATRSTYGTHVAPPTMVTDSMCYRNSGFDADGGVSDRIRVDGTVEIRGENKYTFHRLARADDVLNVTQRIVDVYKKSARSGPLLFVISEFKYRNQNGELLATNLETMIYRTSSGRSSG